MREHERSIHRMQGGSAPADATVGWRGLHRIWCRLNVMPLQPKPKRVATMFENRSLVCETKRDAGAVLAVGSSCAAWSEFETSKVVACFAAVRLVWRFLSSRLGFMESVCVLLLAGLGTMRGFVQVALSVGLAGWVASNPEFRLVASGSARSWLQSNPASFERAARIVGLARSFIPVGITRRSTGLPSAAR